MNETQDSTSVVTSIRSEDHQTPADGAETPGELVGDPVRYIGQVLAYAVKQKASDIHLRARTHPVIRVDSVLQPATRFPQPSVADMEHIATKIMTPRHWDILQTEYQVDISIGMKGIGRVRVNVYHQRGTIAMALRVIQSTVPKPEEINLPPMVKNFVHF
ncbi:MAG: hypothetical protein OEQ18_10110, partial [Gammaproteobacteria bacterium]|nr:hypothetical protein [Gammaproteobacteria bacterium]